MIEYTKPELINDVAVDAVYPRNPYVSGYGPKVPTRYRVKYGPVNRWRRVYVAQYGNSGSAYVTVNGVDLYIDTDTEYRLIDAVNR